MLLLFIPWLVMQWKGCSSIANFLPSYIVKPLLHFDQSNGQIQLTIIFQRYVSSRMIENSKSDTEYIQNGIAFFNPSFCTFLHCVHLKMNSHKYLKAMQPKFIMCKAPFTCWSSVGYSIQTGEGLHSLVHLQCHTTAIAPPSDDCKLPHMSGCLCSGTKHNWESYTRSYTLHPCFHLALSHCI